MRVCVSMGGWVVEWIDWVGRYVGRYVGKYVCRYVGR